MEAEREAFENRARSVLLGMGLSADDVNEGFSIAIDLTSGELSARADKVI